MFQSHFYSFFTSFIAPAFPLQALHDTSNSKEGEEKGQKLTNGQLS